MKDDLQKNVLQNLAEKSELERTLTIGYHGPPELRPEEKAHYLGQFRERVLKMLTRRQVIETKVHPEITEALKDPRAANLYIHGDIEFRHRHKYQRLASRLNIPFTVIHDPDLKGETGLIVAGDTAVDVENITVIE